MNYVKVLFNLEPLLPAREVLLYELSELDFESFVNTKNGLEAYVQKSKFSNDLIENLMALAIPELTYNIDVQEIEQENWNAKWESDFTPIYVEDKLCIRAPFHEKSNLEHEIVISPKMSFGTGHHQTTHLISKALLSTNCKDKFVLDMGCGTGVLGILASKLGAREVLGIDIEDFAYENALENVRINGISNMIVNKGGAELLNNQSFHLILANINRNILLADMHKYVKVLVPNGKIFFSGFYTTDFEVMNKAAENLGLIFDYKLEKDGWAMLSYSKK